MDIKSKQTVPMAVSLPESSAATTWTTSLFGGQQALPQLQIVELFIIYHMRRVEL